MLSEIRQSEKDNYHMISLIESNEQTELTSKIKTDSQTESRLTALGGAVVVEGLSKTEKKERTHGHEQQCSDYRERGSGWRWKKAWGEW